ncbi:MULTISPECIES: AtpZ/AtpI family protein [Tenacibaculum]|uniref:AtpZ/AtpI family protein n=2 Tax=Tenacibaculum TaxID=104267 RepID=A0A3Q8RLC0_9FLAO|nr:MULTISPECIES: AtpZ/AtpI family protein [Tenacibaculum]AZJ34595.1 AtpZ/AtpI family protein [Tenacibaculum singaporense]REH56214.1 putative F0F1-ATPase subunit (Ca2+/Mg2+ transporter) [Tenacibaculum gallaicum]RSC95085.1 AtpZ/AtpI family protein [Tenacibaculum singaporense]
MSKDSKKKPLNKYIRFTGIALQMGLTIYLGSLLGEWLDQKYPNDNQLYVKICTLVAVFGAMLSVIIQVTNLTKNDD